MKKILLAAFALLTVTFASAQTQGYMAKEGANIYLDGRCLTSENIADLMGPKYATTYDAASRQYQNGRTLLCVGWPLFGAGLAAAITGGVIAGNSEKGGYAGVAVSTVGIVSLIGGCVCVPLGYVFRGIAQGRLTRIVESYKFGKYKDQAFSVDLMPAAIPSSTLTSGNSAVPGVTLALTF